MIVDNPDQLRASVQLAHALRLDAEMGCTRITAWARGRALSLAPLWERGYCILLVPVAPVGRRFEIAAPTDPDSRLAMVLEVRDASDERTIDLLAMDAAIPARWRLLTGAARLLGAWNAAAPPAARGGVLRLWRSPLTWIAQGCEGAVLFRYRHAYEALGEVVGPVVAEDIEHAREIAAACRGWMDPMRILVPKTRAAA